MTASAPSFTLAALAQHVGGECRGDGAVTITGLAMIDEAGPAHLTFIGNAKYAKRWPASRAAAAVVTADALKDIDPSDARAVIVVPDADLAMAAILELFAPPEIQPPGGVHPSAFVDASAVLGSDVRIGPHVSVASGVRLGDGVVLHAGVRLYADVVVGAGSVLHANAVVRHGCVIGARVLIHQNVSIGADGFGFRPAPDGKGLVKVPHIGNVILEDDVEIGSNTCIDRGKFGATRIGAGTKIDNLCQIGHNVRIGRSCAISGSCAIAGSSVIGDGVLVGGRAGIRDHLQIGNGVRIGAGSGVTQDVPAGATVLGYPADEVQATLRSWASLRKLPDLMREMKAQKKRRPE